MTTMPEHQASAPTSEDGLEQRPPRFTAVNSNSDDGSPQQRNGQCTNGVSQEHGRPESQSPGKRKRSEAGSPDSTSSHKSRRRRESIGPARTDAYTAPTGNTNGLAYAPAGEGTWPMVDPNSSDAHLVEVLGRANSQHTDHSPQQYHHGTPQHPNHQMHGMNPNMSNTHQTKQRKRNFANRTKSGCMTCRERKKKCDEQKPVCSNCNRGGFICKGYTTAHGVKIPSMPLNTSIQSKNGPYDAQLGPHSTAGYMPGSVIYPVQDHNGQPKPSHENQYRAIPHPRDAGYREQYRPYQESRPAPYTPDSYGQAPAYQDPTRDTKKLTLPMPVHPPSQQRSNSTSSSQYTPRMTAQLALQHEASPPMSHAQNFPNEKSKMINQHPFNPQDSELMQERRKCKIAVDKFNKAADPREEDNAEKNAHFRKIFESQGDHSLKNSEMKDRLGELGNIEAPFHCDYGYNIQIGNHTDIGPNCYIMDACTVKIGARCQIGPDVKFYSQDCMHYNPNMKINGKRLAVAKPIIIEDEVFIGGGSIVLGGVTVGTGATIGAGSIVNRKSVHAKYTSVNRDLNTRVSRYPTAAWD